jgi:hypothetical protein
MRGRAATITVALLAGLGVLLLLFPASGVATDPPECYSMLFFVVPCDAWVAWAAAASAAALVGLGRWVLKSRP